MTRRNLLKTAFGSITMPGVAVPLLGWLQSKAPPVEFFPSLTAREFEFDPDFIERAQYAELAPSGPGLGEDDPVPEDGVRWGWIGYDDLSECWGVRVGVGPAVVNGVLIQCTRTWGQAWRYKDEDWLQTLAPLLVADHCPLPWNYSRENEIMYSLALPTFAAEAMILASPEMFA